MCCLYDDPTTVFGGFACRNEQILNAGMVIVAYLYFGGKTSVAYGPMQTVCSGDNSVVTYG